MTIQREYLGGPHVVQCDDCLDTEELHGETRAEAVKDAKERGYTIHFDGRKCTCSHCMKLAESDAAEPVQQIPLHIFKAAADDYERRMAA